MPTIGTINEEGVNVDMYIPRKCHATNSLIAADDFGSIQIAVADIDPNGIYNGQTKTFCLSGFLRAQAESDHAINRLCIAHGIIRPKTGKKSRAAKQQAKKKIAPKPAAPTKGKPAAPVKGKGPVKGKTTGKTTQKKDEKAPAKPKTAQKKDEKAAAKPRKQ